MSYREVVDTLGMDTAQRAVFADRTALEALRTEMTGKSIVEKRALLKKAQEEKRFSIQAANSPAPIAAETRDALHDAADAARRGDLK
jgi:hypothetical protein